jgi:hypothetical protein
LGLAWDERLGAFGEDGEDGGGGGAISTQQVDDRDLIER